MMRAAATLFDRPEALMPARQATPNLLKGRGTGSFVQSWHPSSYRERHGGSGCARLVSARLCTVFRQRHATRLSCMQRPFFAPGAAPQKSNLVQRLASLWPGTPIGPWLA